MRARNLCVAALVAVLYVIPARAEFVGITNGDFEAQSGKSYSVTAWNESSLTSLDSNSDYYTDWLYKDAGGYLGTDHTEVFGMSNSPGWIYQQIGTQSAGLQVTVSGDAIQAIGGGESFRGFTVELWTGGTASAAGDLVELNSLGATQVASYSITGADLGFVAGAGAQLAHWTTPALAPTGATGSPLWLRIGAGAADGETFLDNITASANPVAEPSTLVLLVVGAFGLLAYAWRKQK